MRSNVLLLALVAFAAAQETPLTECQKCCSPGGDCSKANKGNPGVCCGQSNGGLGYCCPIAVAGRPAKCWNCGSEYRCYTGSRPPPTICGGGGNPSYGRSDGTQTSLISALVAVLCVVLIASAISQCMRARRVPLAAQQDIAMQPVQHYGVPMAKPGQPIVGGQCAGMPVATGVPAGGCYPQAYPAAHGYPAQSGYSGGTVAMGAGMGFLGGMMMGEMMSDVGHHGGGDYGGGYGGGGGDMGGDFAADM